MGNAVDTTTTSAHASFGGATLSGADILNLDIKPTGEYDANFTLATPSFTAPATAASGYYTGTLTSNTIQGNGLLRPNNPGVGTLTFTGQPAVNDTFTVGAVTYKAVAALTGAADEVLIGANLAATIANLIGAIGAASTGGQASGTTYGAGTVANTLATATAGNTASSLNLTATAAALGVAVATTTTSAHAAFSAAVLTAPISTAIEPPSVPLMSQLSWGPAGSTLPARSFQWTVNLTNSIRNGGEGAPADANDSYTTAQVLAGLVQAADASAAIAGLGTASTYDVGTSPGDVIALDAITGLLPAVDGSQLLNLPEPSLLHINPESTGATTPGTGAFTTLSAVTLHIGDGTATFNDSDGFHFNSTINVAGGGSFQQAVTATNGTFSGNLIASGYLSSDGGAVYSDGEGNLTAPNLIAGSFVTSSNAHVFGRRRIWPKWLYDSRWTGRIVLSH